MDISERSIEIMDDSWSASVMEITDEYIVISSRCRKDDCEVNNDDIGGMFEFKYWFDEENFPFDNEPHWPDDRELIAIIKHLVENDEHANIGFHVRLEVAGKHLLGAKGNWKEED